VTPEETTLLRNLYRELAKGEPLDPLNPDKPEDTRKYVPIAVGPEAIDGLQQVVEWSVGESTQFFSGYRGAGKTTELKRLEQRLKGKGFFVVYADATEYLNPTSEITIAELLITLAGSFNDAIQLHLGKNPLKESIWERLGRFLQTNININEANLGFHAKDPASDTRLIASLKAELKIPTSLRKQFQNQLELHTNSLKAEVDKFFEDGVKAIRSRFTPETQVVFIFDSLEQLRGSALTENKVLESVQEIFDTHITRLDIPNVHMVYTVPPWLGMLLPGKVEVVMLHTPKQWEKDDYTKKYTEGRKYMHDIIKKRLGHGGYQTILGEPAQAQPLVDLLIDASGGHVRDLLRMLQALLLKTKTLPVTESVVLDAVSGLREDYRNISVGDARLLARIAETKRLYREDQKQINRLSLLLDLHLALYFKNQEAWYDIHPLVRDEVKALIEIQPNL
jgi:hypothetical protein